MNFVYIDFEYKHSKEHDMTLIAVSFQQYAYKELQEPETFWLLDQDQYVQARSLLYSYIINDWTFVSYNVVAEARCFIEMGFDPRETQWIDLLIEYRMINNHNHSSVSGSAGKHLIKNPNGTHVIKNLAPPKPKWERNESENSVYSRVSFGLESAVYKFLGIEPDAGYKSKMIDIILSNETYTDEQMLQILDYCQSDIHELNALHKAMTQQFSRLLNFKQNRTNFPKYMEGALERGMYAARSALMEKVGYPVNVEALTNFAASVGEILAEVQSDIAHRFPHIEPFAYNKKTGIWKTNVKKIQEWVAANHDKDRWLLTETENFSCSLDAFAREYPARHDYDPNCFGSQMVRFLKTKQSLNGFSVNSKKKTIFDSLGADGRVRPYMGIYGSQSGRSQPSSTAFIHLKSAWMRSLVEPKAGRCIISCDYASQEYLLAALIAKDKKMHQSYASGDPYLAFAKLAGAVPKDATKKSHAETRDLYKTITLGVSYLMGSVGMAKRLTAQGIATTPDEAQELINQFDDVYSGYADWKKDVLLEYEIDGKLQAPCGWTMFGDNGNFRSVCNFPIQAFAASIMRKAVELSQDAGLDVILTLHDALYIECGSKPHEIREAVIKFRGAMYDAFIYYFRDTDEFEGSCDIRLDFDCWSPDWDGQQLRVDGLLDVNVDRLYIDKRSEKEYEKFSKYFVDRLDFLS